MSQKESTNYITGSGDKAIRYWQDLAVANRKVAEDNQTRLTAANAKIAEQAVRLNDAVRDAERYRRLRAWRYELSAGLNFPDSETKWIDENDLDAAIDAAMKECGK